MEKKKPTEQKLLVKPPESLALIRPAPSRLLRK